MLSLKPLGLRPIEVYNSCVSSVADATKRDGLQQAGHEVGVILSQLSFNGFPGSYLSGKFEGGADDLVVGSVTKSDLIDLYGKQLVPPHKPSRKVYDEIKLLSKNQMCPVCGFGTVSTLDHFLPKTNHPVYAVHPLNLIPCCHDCNKIKGSFSPESEEELLLYPYFDARPFSVEQWLYAELKSSAGVNDSYYFEFYVRYRDDWSQVCKNRLDHHFRKFNLNERYAVQAGIEMVSLGPLFETMTKAQIKEIMSQCADGASRIGLNYWKAAMYQAISLADWFLPE